MYRHQTRTDDMANYRKRDTDGPNSEDKALDLFAEMIIEKLETIGKDWKKPGLPRGHSSGPVIFPDANTTA